MVAGASIEEPKDLHLSLVNACLICQCDGEESSASFSNVKRIYSVKKNLRVRLLV